MREIRIGPKILLLPVFHAVNGPSTVGVGPLRSWSCFKLWFLGGNTRCFVAKRFGVFVHRQGWLKSSLE
jgi:hypothetical protein